MIEPAVSTDLVARIGIDWASTHHAYSLREAGSIRVERGVIPHTPEALVDWTTQLQRRFPHGRIGICIETSRGPLVHALLEYDFFVLYPVNPKALKRFREAFATSGAKSDPTDSDLLLDLLVKHPGRLRELKPNDSETRALARLTKARRDAVDMRTRLTQRLRDELKGYFPQALDWVGRDLFRPLATDFLLKWPTLEAVQRARSETVRKFYHAHNCRGKTRIEKRVDEIRTATPLTTDEAIIETSVLKVQMLVRQIQTLGPDIAQFEERIAELFDAHADADLFRSLPGTGPALAPRLLSALGSDRERFESAEEVQKCVGIAPVTKRSGKQVQVQWRWSASTFLRQGFHEFARLSIQQSVWARAYYEQQREGGQDHHAAIRSLAFKWIRIIYRCWMDRTPYDENRYLKALRERGSPLAERIELPAAA